MSPSPAAVLDQVASEGPAAPGGKPIQVIGIGVVLNAGGLVLIDQRLNEGLLGGLWEFPGGKQEPGEAIEATIARELMEELAIVVEVGEELIRLQHSYGPKRLLFVVHVCRWLAGEPQPLACQQLRWVAPNDLDSYQFPAANAGIIAALLGRLGLERPLAMAGGNGDSGTPHAASARADQAEAKANPPDR